MNRKISLGLAISLMAVIATLAVALTYSFAMNTFENRMSAVTDRQATYDLIREVDNKVRQKYYYYDQISDDRMREYIASGMIDSLGDDICEYFTADEWEDQNDQDAGYSFGIGLALSRSSDGNIQVDRTTKGAPAAAAGIAPGDVITAIEGTKVLSVGYSAACDMIADPAAASLKLSVLRDGKDISFTVTKKRFEIISVEYRQMNDIGMISIYEFNATTPAQFNAALNKLTNSGIKGLILDVRDNPGGSYESACDVLDTLLPAGKLMIFTGRSGEQQTLRTSDKSCVSVPFCVLVSENTKGAAELFASAIYDFGVSANRKSVRYNLVGTATAGQFAVQEDFPLSDGSAIRLTTGLWSTTSCAAIEDGKLVPSFEVKLTSYQQGRLHLMTSDEDPQIQTAIELLHNLTEENEPVSDSDADNTASSSDA